MVESGTNVRLKHGDMIVCTSWKAPLWYSKPCVGYGADVKINEFGIVLCDLTYRLMGEQYCFVLFGEKLGWIDYEFIERLST